MWPFHFIICILNSCWNINDLSFIYLDICLHTLLKDCCKWWTFLSRVQLVQKEKKMCYLGMPISFEVIMKPLTHIVFLHYFSTFSPLMCDSKRNVLITWSRNNAAAVPPYYWASIYQNVICPQAYLLLKKSYNNYHEQHFLCFKRGRRETELRRIHIAAIHELSFQAARKYAKTKH